MKSYKMANFSTKSGKFKFSNTHQIKELNNIFCLQKIFRQSLKAILVLIVSLLAKEAKRVKVFLRIGVLLEKILWYILKKNQDYTNITLKNDI